jgi:putative pyrroloquinoline-quinone binding quinoprotein
VIRHSLFLTGAVAMCCLAISGCGPSAPSTTNDYVLISQPSFVKEWDVQLPMHAGDSVKGIYFLDGTVHVLTNKNYDHAVKGDSGALLYNQEIGSPDSLLAGGPVLITNGIVFPTAHTLEVYTRDGDFVRSIDVKYNITNQAVGNHNYVYVGLDFNQGCLAQVDVTQPIDPVQWEFLTFGPVDGPVGISDNVVFCGSEDGKVRGCLEDRSPFWPLLTDSAFDTGSKVVSGVAVDGRSVYCSTLSGTFFCLDKNSGKVRWKYFSGDPLESGPQITDTAVYQYVPSLGLTALEKTKKMTLGDEETVEESPVHSPKWSLGSAGRVLGEDDQFVYVVLGRPETTRGVAAVDKETGKIKFRTHRRDLAFITSQPKGAMIYGVTVNGLVVALKPVAEPGSYGEIAENLVPENSVASLDGLTAHVR